MISGGATEPGNLKELVWILAEQVKLHTDSNQVINVAYVCREASYSGWDITRNKVASLF